MIPTITEKWLVNAAGWQVAKAARAAVESGAVQRAERDGARFTGVVQDGRKRLAAGFEVTGANDVRNFCSCPAARRDGALCAHSVALGIAALRGGEAVAPPDKPGAQTAQIDKVPADLTVFIAPHFTRSWERGSLVAEIGVRLPDGRPASPGTPGDDPLRGFGFDAADVAFASWLGSQGCQKIPRRIAVSPDQSDGFWRALTDHPRVMVGTLDGAGRAERLRVAGIAHRRRLRVGRAGAGGSAASIRCELVPEPGTRVGGVGAWLLADGDLAVIPIAEPDRSIAGRLAPLLAYGEPGTVDLDPRWFAEHADALSTAFAIEDPDRVLAGTGLHPGRPDWSLQVEGSLSNLSAKLTATYGPGLAVAFGEAAGSEPRADGRFPAEVPGRPGFTVRNQFAEGSALARTAALGFGDPDREGWQHLSGERLVLAFFGSGIPALERLGWRVELGERFRRLTAGIERATPNLHFADPGVGEGQGGSASPAANSGWLEATLDFSTASGVTVPAAELRRLLQGGGGTRYRAPGGKTVVPDLSAAEEIANVLAQCEVESGPRGSLEIDPRSAGFLTTTVSDFGGSISGDPFDATGTPPTDIDFDSPGLDHLRPYQREAVQWLATAALHFRGVLLADEMGLGKTIQVLAFLSHRYASGTATRPSLVVAPTSLIETWRSETATFAPDLRTLVLTGPDRASRLANAKSNPSSHHLLLTSYALLGRDADQLHQLDLDTAVLDEASFIKNPKTQTAQAARKLQANFRLALSGTPIENALDDLWSIFAFVSPGTLGSARGFKEQYIDRVKSVSSSKPSASAALNEESRQTLSRLQRRIRPQFLRRTKAEVTPDLPERTEEVVFCDLTPRQAEVYRRILDESRDAVRAAIGKTGADAARMTMLTALLRLRQTCCDLRLLGIESKPAPAPDDSAKIGAFDELVREITSGGHRVLVFSQFVTMLGLLREQLDAGGVNYAYLDGSTPADARAKAVDQFRNQPDTTAFLISLKAGGYGLTLTEADTVIHFDPWWNPAVERQATDRAHRIGQSRPVTAYKLITRGTVEEKILGLQAHKQNLFGAALDDQQPLMSGLTTDDLQSLLEVS